MRKKYDIIFWFLTVLILTLYNLTPPVGGFDVPYYFLAGEHLWNGQIDCLRTPVYPLLLKLFNVWFGERGGIAGVIILQSIVYLISVASVKNICKIIIKNDIVRNFSSLLYVICVAPGLCNEVLTESLSTSGCVIIVDLIFRYIYKPSFKYAFSIAFLTLFLVFLRPSFIFLFAVLPFVWFVLWIRKNKRYIQLVSLILTFLCVSSYFAYCKAYEREFGVHTSSISFVCNDIYNLKRSGVWNLEKVTDHNARHLLSIIEKDISYASIYEAVDSDHKCLPAIVDGCKKMKENSEKKLAKHQIEIIAASFNNRFYAAVNTHTPLSATLFVSSLFLALPLSLFYSVVVISVIVLILYFLRNRSIPLLASILILFITAQCTGILLYASEAHERLLLPVYPIFLILLGLYIEKALLFINHQ